MSKSRRQFLTHLSASFLGTAALTSLSRAQQAIEPPAGAPPAFGTAPPVGPDVTTSTFAEAEKLMQFELSGSERSQAAGNWRSAMAPLYERRTGPRKVEIEPTLPPYSRWDPVLPGQKTLPQRDRIYLEQKLIPAALPSNDEDIAFAPVTQLSRWIEKRQLSSERLTKIYLARLKQFDPKLRCVITLTDELALAQAKKADQEIAAGQYRGPLHGIPWGAKDLLDTAGSAPPMAPSLSEIAFPPRMRLLSNACTRPAPSGRQIKPGCAGAERYLVRRPDHESVASGGRSVGIERRSWRCHCGGTGRFCDRQRNRRQYRQPEHALRYYRTASHLWARTAHRRDDAVLVARQAWPHDAHCGRRHAGAARYLGT